MIHKGSGDGDRAVAYGRANMAIAFLPSALVPGTSRLRAGLIVAVASAVLFATNGFILSGLTVFDSQMLRELGVGNAALRLRDTITVATLGLSVPVVGLLIDKIPVRPILIGGLSLMVVAFAAYNHVHSLWEIYALHVLLGLCQATSGVVSCVFLVSRSTDRHRGLALGIMIAGSSLGNALIPMLNTSLLVKLPWRSAVFSGSVVGCLLIPLVLLVVQEPPREHAANATNKSVMDNVAWSLILRMRDFRILAIIAAVTVFCVLAFATNISLFASSGRLAGGASGPLLLFALFGAAVVAQVAAGAATYRLSARSIHVLALLVMGIGAALFALAPPSLTLVAITLFGLGWGANSTMLQVRPSSIFAGPRLGRVLSLLALAETIGGGLGPVVAGYVRDQSGSFGPSFALVAGVMVLPIALALYPGPSSAAAARAAAG